MASPTTTDINGDRSVMLVTWTLTTADHTGDAVSWADWADRSCQMTGTWGGATAVLEGANVATYISITDPQANAISKNADALEACTEITRFVRPRLSTVGSGATVVVTLLMRRS
jgi:hypothetical protein